MKKNPPQYVSYTKEDLMKELKGVYGILNCLAVLAMILPSEPTLAVDGSPTMSPLLYPETSMTLYGRYGLITLFAWPPFGRGRATGTLRSSIAGAATSPPSLAGVFEVGTGAQAAKTAEMARAAM